MKKFERIKLPVYPDPLIYRMAVGQSGRAWFYPVNIPNPADEILVTDSNEWGKCGEGFGGSTLKLTLVEPNPVFYLNGGWHSNSYELLSDTNIDLRDKHLTRCWISLELEAGNNYLEPEMGDILQEENTWMLGNFERPEEHAKTWANMMGEKVYLAKQSLEGRMYCWVKPDEEEK